MSGKISDDPHKTTLGGTEKFPIADGSTNKYTTPADLITFLQSLFDAKYNASNPSSYISLADITNAIIMAKQLTGLSITGSTIANGDQLIVALGKLQSQINGLIGGLKWQGTWNANTNSPALASGVGTNGFLYRIATAGTTTVDGVSEWAIGDFIVYNGASSVWEKIDNTDKIISVNGKTGVVVIDISDISTLQGILDAKAEIAPAARTGVAIAFDKEAFYGTVASPETGNVTVNATGAVNGVIQILIHQNGSAPTFPGSFVKISGTYSTTAINYIYIMRINSTKYHYTITQEP